MGGENGYIAPAPTIPRSVYGGNDITRYNRCTGADRSIARRPSASRGYFRRAWTLAGGHLPDRGPTTLYFSNQMMFRSLNGGILDADQPD